MTARRELLARETEINRSIGNDVPSRSAVFTMRERVLSINGAMPQVSKRAPPFFIIAFIAPFRRRLRKKGDCRNSPTDEC